MGKSVGEKVSRRVVPSQLGEWGWFEGCSTPGNSAHEKLAHLEPFHSIAPGFS